MNMLVCRLRRNLSRRCCSRIPDEPSRTSQASFAAFTQAEPRATSRPGAALLLRPPLPALVLSSSSRGTAEPKSRRSHARRRYMVSAIFPPLLGLQPAPIRRRGSRLLLLDLAPCRCWFRFLERFGVGL
jgi:hypothetical protein